MFPRKKKYTSIFKTLSNNKYKYLNLENLIYYINYNLLKNSHNILRKFWK